MRSTRPRCTDCSQGTLLNTIRANTVTFENSFNCRAPRSWNTLPAHLWNVDCSVVHFKNEIFDYYLYFTKSVYDVYTPKTYKSVVQRGRRKKGEGESEKRERESINQHPLPFLPIPYPRSASTGYQVPHQSAIDQFARSNVWLILLSMFALILFVIAVFVVSSALSLLYACICMYLHVLL